MAKIRAVTTTIMPKIQNYYTKYKGKWVTEYTGLQRRPSAIPTGEPSHVPSVPTNAIHGGFGHISSLLTCLNFILLPIYYATKTH